MLSQCTELGNIYMLSCSVMSDSQTPCEPGKNTRVGYHFLHQGIFLTQGLKPPPHPFLSPALQADSLPTEEAPNNIDIAHQPHGYRAEQTILSYFHLQLPASLTKHQISKLPHHRRPSVTLSHFLSPAFPSFSKIICRLKFS